MVSYDLVESLHTQSVLDSQGEETGLQWIEVIQLNLAVKVKLFYVMK